MHQKRISSQVNATIMNKSFITSIEPLRDQEKTYVESHFRQSNQRYVNVKVDQVPWRPPHKIMRCTEGSSGIYNTPFGQCLAHVTKFGYKLPDYWFGNNCSDAARRLRLQRRQLNCQTHLTWSDQDAPCVHFNQVLHKNAKLKCCLCCIT